jgi:solute carrier family 8 (sodium/calcium exchanger)
MFVSFALCAIFILMLRRNPSIGGELGGPKGAKTASASIFVCFWVTYVALSAMEAYGVINPGL